MVEQASRAAERVVITRAQIIAALERQGNAGAEQIAIYLDERLSRVCDKLAGLERQGVVERDSNGWRLAQKEAS